MLRFDLRLPRRGVAMAAEIPLGGLTAVIGKSGSGKTTLLRLLAGLEPGVEGRASCGAALWQDGARRLPVHERGIGLVFQDSRLFPHMSVAANLGYGARRRGVPAERLAGIVEDLGLAPLLGRRPDTLSGGEARRVALGRALATAPRVLFLDEPLTGLDDARKARLMPLIAQATARAGVPALYVTHSAREVAALADRVLRIEEGRVAGWDRVPPRLTARVLRAGGGQVVLGLAGREVTVPGRAEPGALWALPLPPRAVALGAAAPLNAAFSLPARLRAAGPGATTLDVDGQTVTLPLTLDAPPAPGSALVLALMSVFARPLEH